MKIQPSIAPILQTGTFLPNAKIKFSVPIENIKALQIVATLLFGFFPNVINRLPRIFATPVTVLTIPRAALPPPLLDNSIAGKAALYIEAVKLIAAKNKINWRMPLLIFRYVSPDFALYHMLSSDFKAVLLSSGILMKNTNEVNAIKKVIRSMMITSFIPAKARTAVAIAGVKIVVRELENDLIPLTF
jgi:hypothetical protein